jgi:hypothetical protein
MMAFWSRVLTLLLALAVALPLTTFAGGGKAASDTSSSPAAGSAGDTKGKTDAGVKSKDTGGQASPATTTRAPASRDACKDNGWQKYGFKTEAECVSAVPMTGAGTKK